jgi:NADH-quinone oxidoreductase subunit G
LLEVETLLKHPDDKDIASSEAVQIANDLQNAANPAIVSEISDIQILRVCLRIALLLGKGGFYYDTKQANAMALAVLTDQGLDTLVKRLEQRPPNTLIVMETDLYRYFDDQQMDKLLDQVKHIIVLDQHLTRTAQMADLVLPSASAFESHGCWINAEGRVQKSYAVMATIKNRLPAPLWLQTLTGLHDDNQVLTWVSQAFELFQGIERYVFDYSSDFSLARMPLRASSRTAINAAIDVKEYPPAQDNDAQMTFSMEGVPNFRQQQLKDNKIPVTGVWQPKWNSGQGIVKSLNENADAGFCLFRRKSIGEVQLQGEKSAVSCDGIRLCGQANIYGDDELAAYSGALQQLTPKPQARLCSVQAQSLGIKQGDPIYIKDKQLSFELPCIIDDTVAQGVVLIPKQHFMQLSADAHIGSAP